jgi:hypothetical protein
MGRVVEESNLLSVPATPFAKEEVNPETHSLDQRQLSVKGLRLKAAGLLAGWGQHGNRFGKRSHQIRLLS